MNVPREVSDPSLPVVLKLGGSLLGMPDLRPKLEGVLDRYCDTPRLLVVGGGAAADLVRDWDRRHELEDDISHDLALEAMSFNARFVSALLQDAALVTKLEDCEAAWRESRPAIVDAAAFVPSLEATAGEELPHTWDATSDSISAWLAGRLAADRLVLLKSVDAPPGGELGPDSGLVDPTFSRICHRVRRIEWINLRAAGAESCEVVVQPF